MEKMLLNVEDVMTALGVRREELVDLISNDGLPAFKLGGELKFNINELEKWVDDRSKKERINDASRNDIMEMVLDSRDIVMNRESGHAPLIIEEDTGITDDEVVEDNKEHLVDIDEILQHAEYNEEDKDEDKDEYKTTIYESNGEPGKSMYEVVDINGDEPIEIFGGYSIKYKIFETHVRISPEVDLTDTLFEQLFKTLTDLDINVMNASEFRKSLIDNQGNWICLTEAPNPFRNKVNIKVSSDGQRAYMVACSTDNTGTLNMAEVRNAISELGITTGIDHELIDRVVSGSMFGQVALIAYGEPPETGETSTIEYKFDIESALTKKIIASEEFNEKILEKYKRVNAGEVLLAINEAMAGKTGTDIWGNTLEAEKCARVEIKAGRNVDYSEDGSTLSAAADGYVVMNDTTVSVEPLKFFKGDLNAVRGNIDFDGIVIIEGFVKTGLCVETGSDIIINGGVEGAEVKSRNGDIIIKLGIQGRDRAIIEAAGNVSAKFIDKSKITAGGDVRVEQAIMNSCVTAGGEVESVGEKGRIIGGTITAQDRVAARFAGSDSNVATEIIVEMRETLDGKCIRDVLAGQRESIASEVTKCMNVINRMKTKVFDEKKDIAVIRQIETQRSRAKKLNEIMNRINEDLARLNRSYGAGGSRHIEIIDTVYPNVTLEIEGIKRSFRKEEKGATFCCSPEKFLVNKKVAD